MIKRFKNWWSFLRFQNIVIIILTQYLIRFFIIEKNIDFTNLSSLDFLILILTTSVITIGGNLINDIYDYPIDKINKPEKTFINQLITIKTAWKVYLLIQLTTLVSIVYFYFFTNWKTAIIYFSITPILLWFYSYRLKKTVLTGNLVVAFLCALVPIMVIYSEFTPQNNRYLIAELFVGFYALFAFLSTLFREIVKDIEDKEGDEAYGAFTLPIRFGQKVAKSVALAIGLILLIVIIGLMIAWENASNFQLIYIFIFILLPIVYAIFKLFKAQQKKDFHQVSQIIKLIMLFGLLFLIIL